MHVVATAGHVDHGKSTLVRALTGTDPDRLAEEKRRGLTIELGHVSTHLEGVGDVAFVDVPGHERFLPTMLAGVGPVPAVLLVVAADDGWMPQTAEHVAVLDALGVNQVVLAVTRADLADPGPALASARHHLALTGLADPRSVVVSARTGAGLAELRSVLVDLLTAMPAPDPEADVRLWVDRSFRPRGAGLVVTGTLPAGAVRVGDVLEADGTPVRVRALESLGRSTGSVNGSARVALDLGSGAPDSIRRGSVLLTPGAWWPTDVVDVVVRGPESLPRAPRLHVGATSTTVHARLLEGRAAPDAGGEVGGFLVRLRLDRALPLRVGDRAVLRDPGDRAVWGAEVLDPAPPPLGRRGAAADRAARLRGSVAGVEGEVVRRGIVSREQLRRIGVPADLEGADRDTVIEAGEWLVSAERAERLRAAVLTTLEQAAATDRPAVPLSVLARDLAVPSPDVLAQLLAGDSRCVVRAGTAELAGARALPVRLASALTVLRDHLAADPFAAPDAVLLAELGLSTADLAVLSREGALLRLADAVVLLPGAAEEAVTALADLPDPFTVSQARTRLGTSRRVVLPLLAHLDASGRTLRLPDDRRRLRR